MKTLSEKQEQTLAKIITGQLGVEEAQLTDDARIKEDLCADSLDTVSIIMALEEEFEITVPDEASEKVSTVGDVKQLLMQYLSKVE